MRRTIHIVSSLKICVIYAKNYPLLIIWVVVVKFLSELLMSFPIVGLLRASSHISKRQRLDNDHDAETVSTERYCQNGIVGTVLSEPARRNGIVRTLSLERYRRNGKVGKVFLPVYVN